MKPTDKSLIAYYKEIDLTGKEAVRYYRFPDEEIVQITAPVTLIVSDNGHRIVDAEGNSHYVPYGWIHLWWKNTPGREEGKGFLCQEGYDLDKPEAEADEADEVVYVTPELLQKEFDVLMSKCEANRYNVKLRWLGEHGGVDVLSIQGSDRIEVTPS